ncbi:hypothetical protein TNCT_263771 [Trichonephila clavata]|uniref:Uncharacterized protein n=1 Tax=Trichonephila clavata TaxID=2740835 RepID=A0A8X6IVX1_TRICU|nr:hypothetical protein TNCT_263771 [Trichonephila clavata]
MGVPAQDMFVLSAVVSGWAAFQSSASVFETILLMAKERDFLLPSEDKEELSEAHGNIEERETIGSFSDIHAVSHLKNVAIVQLDGKSSFF